MQKLVFLLSVDQISFYMYACIEGPQVPRDTVSTFLPHPRFHEGPNLLIFPLFLLLSFLIATSYLDKSFEILVFALAESMSCLKPTLQHH